MMEGVSTSESSENFYQTTQRNIPEVSHLPGLIYLRLNYAVSSSDYFV
jgi:hypothetical protein